MEQAIFNGKFPLLKEVVHIIKYMHGCMDSLDIWPVFWMSKLLLFWINGTLFCTVFSTYLFCFLYELFILWDFFVERHCQKYFQQCTCNANCRMGKGTFCGQCIWGNGSRDTWESYFRVQAYFLTAQLQ